MSPLLLVPQLRAALLGAGEHEDEVGEPVEIDDNPAVIDPGAAQVRNHPALGASDHGPRQVERRRERLPRRGRRTRRAARPAARGPRSTPRPGRPWLRRRESHPDSSFSRLSAAVANSAPATKRSRWIWSSRSAVSPVAMERATPSADTASSTVPYASGPVSSLETRPPNKRPVVPSSPRPVEIFTGRGV